MRAHLERIDKRDADVLAWSHLAREAALERARVLDRGPRQGLLHGVPMGVKDIIDSYDQPTTYGSPIYKTHQPLADAATMALARDAGAILLGKTVTTEFANRHPGKTRNPHNPAHTPGGSSSGSAAAVADCQVVLATGTQTGGSVIRPAAFCGVVRLQAELRPFPGRRHEGQHRVARHDRRLCPQPRRHRAVPRRADGDPAPADREARHAAAHRRLLHAAQGRAAARGHRRDRGRRRPSSPRRAPRSPSSRCRAEMFDDARGPADAQRLRRPARRGRRGAPLLRPAVEELPGGQARGRQRRSTTRPGSPPASSASAAARRSTRCSPTSTSS